MGHPDGESGVLLTKGLTGLDDSTERTADKLADSKLEETEEEAQEGDEEEEQDSGLGMDDILHGGAGDNEEGGGPEVIGEVADGDDPAVETMERGGVLDDISEEEGEQEDEGDLIEDGKERREEREMDAGLEQGEGHGDEEDSGEIGEEGMGGGLFERAPELLRDDSGGSGSRGDNTHEGGLGKDEGIALQAEHEDEGHHEEDEEEVEEGDAPVPGHGTEATEIDLAEGDEEDEEHEQGHDGIADGGEEAGGAVECGDIGEDEIDHGSDGHGKGEGPVLDETQHDLRFTIYRFTICDAKVLLFFESEKN